MQHIRSSDHNTGVKFSEYNLYILELVGQYGTEGMEVEESTLSEKSESEFVVKKYQKRISKKYKV